jgi:hypothetical protein
VVCTRRPSAARSAPRWPEGRFGFLQAFCGDCAHPDLVVRGLGTDWELPRVVFKLHPREARVEVNRGGPGNALSDEELARKFHDNAVRSLPEERAAELAARTLAFPDAQSVADLTALLTSAGER